MSWSCTKCAGSLSYGTSVVSDWEFTFKNVGNATLPHGWDYRVWIVPPSDVTSSPCPQYPDKGYKTFPHADGEDSLAPGETITRKWSAASWGKYEDNNGGYQYFPKGTYYVYVLANFNDTSEASLCNNFSRGTEQLTVK